MRRSLFVVLSLVLLVALAAACTSSGPKPAATGPATAGTATVAALAATPRPPTALPLASPGASVVTPAVTGAAMVTAGPSAASTAAPAVTGAAATCTDRASMTQDVTVPDNTAIAAGQTFVKTWRLRNTGTCTWDTSYSLIFVKGNNLGGPVSVPLSNTVAPGASIDASVNLTAPTAAGTYKGNWQLRNGRGTAFGIATSDGTFWVQIVVGPSARVTFPAGASTATLNATLVKGVPRGYALQVQQAGQKVTVKASTASNAALTVQDASGSPVTITQAADKQWAFTAAQAGEYTLVWRGTGPMTFTVTLTR